MAVTNQPSSYPPSEFQTGLFDCCDDRSLCCYGCWCLPCLGCSIARQLDQSCMCGLSEAIRGVYRTKYNIKGSLWQDYMAVLWCLPCAACQLKRDIDRRKEQGVFEMNAIRTSRSS